jgi:hypothetical protein
MYSGMKVMYKMDSPQGIRLVPGRIYTLGRIIPDPSEATWWSLEEFQSDGNFYDPPHWQENYFSAPLVNPYMEMFL